MRGTIQIVCVVCVAALGSTAMAVDIATVPVGNAGNPADDTGYGAVA